MTGEIQMTKQFTFSNGTVIEIGKIPPLLIQKINKAYPAPKPPVERIDMGDGIFETHENTAHPDYLQAVQDHQSHLEEMFRNLTIQLGVKSKLTDEQLEQVKAQRELMASVGVELEPDDKYVFVSYVAVETSDDYTRLLQAVMEESQPTEARIQAIEESFQGEVPGEATQSDPSQIIGD
jgi:hypothetical protein